VVEAIGGRRGDQRCPRKVDGLGRGRKGNTYWGGRVDGSIVAEVMRGGKVLVGHLVRWCQRLRRDVAGMEADRGRRRRVR